MRTIYVESRKYGKKEIKVDDEDYDYLTQWKWCVGPRGPNKELYASRADRTTGSLVTISMHRFIMKENDPSVFIDHWDHDTLNNCKSNLRKATVRQSIRNRRKWANTFSSFKGVSEYVSSSKSNTYRFFRARIMIDRKMKSLGLFHSELDAAIAYNEAAIKYHGEFAHLNQI